jgi:uncharacterized protein YdeI (YjbR/CyaY-like superfamily)
MAKSKSNEEQPETFYPKSKKHWRQWLEKNHNKKQSIWVICYKKKTDVPTMTWSESVDEALCFGWIDSLRRPVDNEKFMQYYCRRKPKSGWSKINKEKVKRLIEEGLMTKAGLDAIEVAKKNGAWSMLDAVEELKIPADLNKQLKAQPKAKKYFMSLSRSNKRVILQWITFAKREETRAKRIKEFLKLADEGLMPKQFRPVERVKKLKD